MAKAGDGPWLRRKRSAGEAVSGSHAYPLFDDRTGDLVRAAIAEGAWELGAGPRRRCKQAAAAARLMEALPAFPRASIAEVVEIRDRLRVPLVRFRAAVIEMERLIESAAVEADFALEVDELYRQKIAPALEEIREAIADDAYLRQLVGAAVADAKTFVARALAMGVAHFADVR